MPVSLNTPVLGCDDNAPAEIYARHLKCSPPLSLKEQAWRQYSFELNYPEIMGPDFNNNVSDTDKSTNCSVQVKLELGHKALTRKRATAEGFTHDWTMFVRGPEGSNIQHFVDRVVFHLHESFPKPKRVVKEPPYQINESGYAGFNLPIEIYFKNKDDPKKIIFSYDLFLHTPHAPPVNHVRCEKLTFQNPSEEFRRKLVKAGGVAILGPNDQQGQPPSVTQTASPAHTQAHSPEQYADLFGAPSKPEALKTSPPKSCPPKIESVKSSTPAKAETTSQKKHKSSASKDRTGGRSKLSSSSIQSSSVSPSTVTPPSIVTPPSTPSKILQPPQPPSKNSGSKHKDKAAKRALEALSAESSNKKRKEMGATEPSKERNTKKEREKRDQEKAKASEEKEKRDKEKERKKEKKSSSKESKNKHKSSKKDAVKPAKVAEPAKASSALPAEITPPALPPPLSLPLPLPEPEPEPEPEQVAEPVVTPIVVKTLAAKKQQPSSLQMLDELSLGEISGFEDDMDIEIPADMITDVCSPASTLSFSSMKGTTGGEGGGPLGALFAEMDDDEIPLSPLPPTSPPSIPLPIPQPLQQQSHVPPPQILHKPPKITIGPPDTTKEPVASPVESVQTPVTSRKEHSPPVQEPAPATGKATKKREKESRRSRTDRRTKEASKENKDVSKDIPASKSMPKDIISKDLFRDYRSDNVAATIEAKSASTVTTGAKEAPCTTADLGERDMNNISLQGQGHGQGHQPGVVAPNGESLNVLLELQRRLMGMTDRDLVQQVVNVIEETGMYKISDATFDFDLCSLDIITVKKLQVCLEMQC